MLRFLSFARFFFLHQNPDFKKNIYLSISKSGFSKNCLETLLVKMLNLSLCSY